MIFDGISLVLHSVKEFTMEKTSSRIPSNQPTPDQCLHGRIVEPVRTKDGQPTGQLQCLECHAIFDERLVDPGRQSSGGS